MKQTDTKRLWLYVLKLEQGKYYVGITSKTPEHRFKQHVNGFAGAAWTRQYKPLSILDTKDLGNVAYADAEKYENRVVRSYIKKYGLNNVGGGDIRTTEQLVNRFGWLFSQDGWKNMMAVLILMAVILFLAVYSYTK